MSDPSTILNERLLNGTLQIGSVRVESIVAEYPLGISYSGMHVGLDVPVMIRTLRPSIKSELSDFPRFMQEIRKLGRLRHPPVVE